LLGSYLENCQKIKLFCLKQSVLYFAPDPEGVRINQAL